MDHGDLQQQFETIRRTMELQSLQLAALNAQQVQQRENKRDSEAELVLAPQIAACIPPHLQLAPLESADRKRILRRYNKVKCMPKCIKDDNGLAAHSIGSDKPEIKKWIHDRYPLLQRQHLDIARIGAVSWQEACALRDENPAGAAEILVTAIRDIITLACDNAQCAAQQQLKQTLDAAGQSPVYALLDLSADSTILDYENTNVLQQAHMDAFTDLKDFRGAIDAARPKQNGAGRGVGQGGNNRGGRGRGKGGKGRGRGRGRGGGKGFNQPADQAVPNGP
jgi:hypothetical protein